VKWLRTLVLFDKGGIVTSSDWKAVHAAYVRAIQRIEHPAGAGKLTLRRKKYEKESKQWDRNGVSPLKTQFFRSMVGDEGWQAEAQFDIARLSEAPEIRLYPCLDSYREPVTSEFGHFDFVTTAPSGTHVAIEWETGNISSSHRSLNKLAIALGAGKIHAGVLILPSRDLYEHLTDRIGNIGELSPYLAMWSGLASTVERGLLALTVVEHDELTDDEAISYLKSGKDGRSREGKRKRKTASRKNVQKMAAKKVPI
jgi:Restriction endonuclease BamHI